MDHYRTVLMASSSGEQPSWEDRTWGGGAFTKALKDGLRGFADFGRRDKVVKHKELGLYVDENVPEMTKKVRNHKQIPSSMTPAFHRSR